MFYLIRGVAMHESSSFSTKDSLGDCGRPFGPQSCLLFSALWLRSSQSEVVQETPSAKHADITCSITFLFSFATCLPVGLLSLDWPVHPFGRSDSSGPSLPPDASSDELRRVALHAYERSRWRRSALQAQPKVLQRTTGEMDVLLFSKACDAGCLFRHRNREFKLNYLKKLLDQNNIILSPRSKWKGRVSPGCGGIGSAVQVFRYLQS